MNFAIVLCSHKIGHIFKADFPLFVTILNNVQYKYLIYYDLEISILLINWM